MCKPKLLKTFIVVLLLWKPTLSRQNLFEAITQRQIFYDDNIVSINDLQGRARTINTKNLDDLMDEHSYLVYTSIKCKYADAIVEILQTFFEINEYGLNAPTDIQIPNIKVITKKWLVSSIKHLHSIKPPIVKMIHNLFSYFNNYEVLRTSDPSLLKSLLSINLFLSYSMNDGMFHNETTNPRESIRLNRNDTDFENFLQIVRNLNTSIIQMIGFVERFRNKRCVVHDPYKNNHLIQKQISDSLTPLIVNVNNLKTMLDKTWKNLHFLVNNESDDYSNFDSDIYDFKYLLFKRFLQNNNSFLENVKSQLYGSEFDLLSKYSVVKKTYSIEKTLEFQYSLINVIAEIFYGQIYNIVTNPNVNMDDISTFEELDNNFATFIKLVLPKSCSINVCHDIIKNRFFLHDVHRNSDTYSLTEMVTSLKDKFKPDESKRVIYEIIRIEYDNDKKLSSLKNNFVVNSQYNVPFRNVFDLLSYESHTNSNFDVVMNYKFTGITQSQSFDTDFVKSMIELQCVLFTFRTILYPLVGFIIDKNNLNYSNFDLKDYFSNKFTSAVSVNDGSRDQWQQVNISVFVNYKTNVANILNVIARLYDFYSSKPDIQNILLPMLIRLRHTEENTREGYDYEFQVMFQSSFITITLIENYLINNNLFPFYSVFVYSKLMVYDENKQNVSYFHNRMNIYLQSDVKHTPFSDSVKLARTLFDSPTYTTLFRTHDNEMKCFWNGQGLIGNKILKIFQSGVIDFNELISFQWFGVKFLVGKILFRVKNALSLLIDKNKSQVIHEINVITNKLTGMLLVQRLPMSLHTFLKDLVDATIKLLNATDVFDSDHCSQWVEMYEENFEALGLTLAPEHSTRYPRINEIATVIDSELKNLKVFLEMPFLGAQNILNLTEFILSPTCYMYPDDSIRMLYNYQWC